MKESIENLFNKMNGDKEFAEKIMSQTEKEKVIEISKEENINLTMEDIDEANKIIQKALEQKDEGELSEEELENVAGGTWEIAAFTVCTAAVNVTAMSAMTISAAVSAGVSATAVVSGALTATEIQKNNQGK